MYAICKWCGAEFHRPGTRKPVFCTVRCKAEWQRTQKPIDREKLFKLYTQDRLGTYQIAQTVGRDPKRVYEWLKDYGIKRRRRQWDTASGKKPYHHKAWLWHEYVNNRRSAKEIARQFGVHENNILFFLAKHGIPRRKMDQIRAVKYWGASGPDNPMYGKRGASTPNWKGGVTPERQAFYQSEAWKCACKTVWKRDKATCQRCGVFADGGVGMHVHHIVSFAVQASRADASNLVLLCQACHSFIHSSANKSRECLGRVLHFDTSSHRR